MMDDQIEPDQRRRVEHAGVLTVARELALHG